MAICNTFNELTNETGNFLSFSQYTKDLTQYSVEGSKFKVMPSKFIALDIKFNEFNNTLLNTPDNDLNRDIPRYFQNIFENACAYCYSENPDFAKENIKNLFWWSLINSGLLSKTGLEIKYIGDINIQNYNILKDGMGYGDIFCYIPNEAREQKYTCTYTSNDITYYINEKTYIEGYTNKDNLSLDGSLTGTDKYFYKNVFKIGGSETINSNSFKINTIIVLYDILNDNNTKINSDLPLGIYFPGTFDSENQNQMTNEITKYSSNSDAYGTGTSYGLRICYRFTPAPNNTKLTFEIKVDQGEDYTAFSQVMTAFAETHAKLNELMESTINNMNAYKELYAIFKNSRTNVPYLKQIGITKDEKTEKEIPINHWFVNGRDMGQEGQSIIYKDIESYTDSDVKKAIDDWNENNSK